MKDIEVSYLEYKNAVVGYRIRLRYNNEYKYYDVGLGVGVEEGLDKLVERGTRIKLYLREDMLLSTQEMKEGIEVETITDNVLLIRELKKIAKTQKRDIEMKEGDIEVNKSKEEVIYERVRCKVGYIKEDKKLKECIAKELLDLGYYGLLNEEDIEGLKRGVKELMLKGEKRKKENTNRR